MCCSGMVSVSHASRCVQVTVQWYVVVGVSICLTILINIFVPHIAPLLGTRGSVVVCVCVRVCVCVSAVVVTLRVCVCMCV